MTLNEIRALPEFDNHDKICKMLFERIYNSRFPDKHVKGEYEFLLRATFDESSQIHFKGNIEV